MDGSYRLGGIAGRRSRLTGREMERMGELGMDGFGLLAGPEGKMAVLVEGLILSKI